MRAKIVRTWSAKVGYVILFYQRNCLNCVHLYTFEYAK